MPSGRAKKARSAAARGSLDFLSRAEIVQVSRAT
jgi:hypothetical protein